jgi:hypothetical protein
MVLAMCWQVFVLDDETHGDVVDEDVVESGTRFWRVKVGQTWRASSWLTWESPRRASGGKGISRAARTRQSDMRKAIEEGKAMEHGSSAGEGARIDNKDGRSLP